ncbi:hypothetical protein DFJ77DRAFT_243942 [Powellomyces hirtus]|nr:hypothetical protein DFJ77DRAFT_243942 [Powellomyces hirtus]
MCGILDSLWRNVRLGFRNTHCSFSFTRTPFERLSPTHGSVLETARSRCVQGQTQSFRRWGGMQSQPRTLESLSVTNFKYVMFSSTFEVKIWGSHDDDDDDELSLLPLPHLSCRGGGVAVYAPVIRIRPLVIIVGSNSAIHGIETCFLTSWPFETVRRVSQGLLRREGMIKPCLQALQRRSEQRPSERTPASHAALCSSTESNSPW